MIKESIREGNSRIEYLNQCKTFIQGIYYSNSQSEPLPLKLNETLSLVLVINRFLQPKNRTFLTKETDLKTAEAQKFWDVFLVTLKTIEDKNVVLMNELQHLQQKLHEKQNSFYQKLQKKSKQKFRQIVNIQRLQNKKIDFQKQFKQIDEEIPSTDHQTTARTDQQKETDLKLHQQSFQTLILLVTPSKTQKVSSFLDKIKNFEVCYDSLHYCMNLISQNFSKFYYKHHRNFFNAYKDNQQLEVQIQQKKNQNYQSLMEERKKFEKEIKPLSRVPQPKKYIIKLKK